MRNFDPMQGAEEECGMLDKIMRSEFGCGIRKFFTQRVWGLGWEIFDPSRES
jgi:hypothetical protein